jgi:metal transporter CNNM
MQALFRRAELKALVDVHGSMAGFGGTLNEDEIHVIR